MPTVPPILSQDSSDRMLRVAEAADELVDRGVPPAEAIAKSARDLGLPVHHLDVTVRAFNTGRAVRQLSETDPWAKAASYPSTTTEEVLAAMGREPADTKTSHDADYLFPPDRELREQVLTAPVRTKTAAAPVETPPPPPEPVKRAGPLTALADAAAAFDALRDEVRRLTDSQYAAVKVAAEFAHPGVGREALEYVESYDTLVNVKAARAARTVPDPTVTTAHPAVACVSRIADARSRYSEPQRPLGYEKCAFDASDEWSVRRRQMPSVDALNEPEKAAGITGTADFVNAYARDRKADAPKPDGATSGPKLPISAPSFGSSFRKSVATPFTGVVSNPLTAPLLDFRAADLPSVSSIPATELRKLDLSLNRLDQQSTIQDVVSDPRLARSDPRLVIDTFRTLSDLAPNVMKNRSVAADLIHRRLQTGPLSAFDLKQLLDMEQAWVKSRQLARVSDDDEA